MKTESKILIGFLVVLIVAVPLISSVMAVDINNQEADEYNNLKERVQLAERNHQRRQHILWLLKDAEKETITGLVTARDRDILILTDSDESRFNIVCPRRWNMGSDVISLNQIFDEGYVSIGETITVEVLMRTVTNDNAVTLTAIVCYEISTSENSLYAVLPINIS